jgi:hypothetical protein
MIAIRKWLSNVQICHQDIVLALKHQPSASQTQSIEGLFLAVTKGLHTLIYAHI